MIMIAGHRKQSNCMEKEVGSQTVKARRQAASMWARLIFGPSNNNKLLELFI